MDDLKIDDCFEEGVYLSVSKDNDDPFVVSFNDPTLGMLMFYADEIGMEKLHGWLGRALGKCE